MNLQTFPHDLETRRSLLNDEGARVYEMLWNQCCDEREEDWELFWIRDDEEVRADYRVRLKMLDRESDQIYSLLDEADYIGQNEQQSAVVAQLEQEWRQALEKGREAILAEVKRRFFHHFCQLFVNPWAWDVIPATKQQIESIDPKLIEPWQTEFDKIVTKFDQKLERDMITSAERIKQEVRQNSAE